MSLPKKILQMTKQKARSKLLKLIGKEVVYTATLERFSSGSAILVDVCYKGKEVADHVWINKSKILCGFDIGSRLCFKATAYTYKDTNGKRKHGLTEAHGYNLDTLALETLRHDKEHARRRRG